jgi:hypothetical protein
MIRIAALALSIVFASVEANAAMPPLASTRAIYDVALDHTSGASVIAARGRLAIEFRDTCSGWSTVQRMIVDMTDADGTRSRTDFFVTAWERKDGRSMRFDIGNLENGKPIARQKGYAYFAADGNGAAILASGKPPHFALPRGALFPTAQTLAILRHARSGGAEFSRLVFQGGDASEIHFSTVAIGKPLDSSALTVDRKIDPKGLLAGKDAWPVLTSFYPMAGHATLPDYEVATHLYTNGVSGSMSLIYKSYTLRAILTHLEPLSPSC